MIIEKNLYYLLVGYWKIVGNLPLGMSDHCMVSLNGTHAVLNAGEWLPEGEAMTGGSYVLDIHNGSKGCTFEF